MSPVPLSLLSLLGRLLLASLFLLAGPGKIFAPGATAAYMASGGLPANAGIAMFVGLFEVVCGLSILFGYKARWAALALALFTLVASLVFHAFWAAPPEQQFVTQLLFSKNMAVVGALLFITAVGSGPWSVDASTGNAPRRSAGAFDH